ncbi:10867_t:CDS:2 [Cetraspora pellucida]|uniref:10867_t:CDS:1 n=1 Tax=Cetraspora pellucida TaxID=1433469 RepID=A0A9N8WIG2_9GLOM|nr:10867_t:CDS:2 [Cetraspora pellucida]
MKQENSTKSHIMKAESLQENFFYKSQHIDDFEYEISMALDTSDDLKCNFFTALDMSNSSIQLAVTEEIEL